MIKKNIIFPALILLTALSVYLIDKDISKCFETIEAQQAKIDNLEV